MFIFKLVFFLSDCMIVLSSQFKNKLISWGYDKPIYLETTVVDEELIKGISDELISRKYDVQNNETNILFLARVEKAKGIYEAVDCYNILKKKYPELSLRIAGDGFELMNVKSYVRNNSINDVEFLGFVTGVAKFTAYWNSHIYILPSYSEGMPNSVLEAMALGLPVVTRNVGGLVDFFKNNEHGFMTVSKDPELLAGLTEELLKNNNLLKTIALNNYRYAVEKFTTSKVIERLENIYKQFL